MKNLFTILIISIVLLGCQTPFESKTQAKNEVNKNGYRIGRWIDYMDSTGVQTNDFANSMYYLLSEYKDGKPIGNFKFFSKDNSIIYISSFKSDSTLYDKNTLPSTSKIVGIKVYFSDNQIKRKEVSDREGSLVRQIFYTKNTDINKIDSSLVEYERFPSKKIKEMTFSNFGKDKIKIFYDELPWIENADTNYFHSDWRIKPNKTIEFFVKEKFVTKFSKDLSDEFRKVMFIYRLIDRIHYIDFGNGKSDLQIVFRKVLNEEKSKRAYSTSTNRGTISSSNSQNHLVAIPSGCEVFKINNDGRTGYNVGAFSGFIDGNKILNSNRHLIGSWEFTPDGSGIGVRDKSGILRGTSFWPPRYNNKVYSTENDRFLYIVKSDNKYCLLGAMANLIDY